MKYYIVDAFAEEGFTGNPAGVCVLERAVEDEWMQRAAAENNLSETAFLRKKEEGYGLRWFTPTLEIDLCGHATLAAAYVVSHFLNENGPIRFDTKSGRLTALRRGELIEMDFPSVPPRPVQETRAIAEAIGADNAELYAARDLFAVLQSEEEVRRYVPDYTKLRNLDGWLGMVVTAKGEHADFVSRYFCPELGLEDPVTGSSHSSLIPYWAKRLGKKTLIARQLSKRGGTLYCTLDGSRVKIAGKAVLYMRGEILE